jgi:hypothetical protein
MVYTGVFVDRGFEPSSLEGIAHPSDALGKFGKRILSSLVPKKQAISSHATD